MTLSGTMAVVDPHAPVLPPRPGPVVDPIWHARADRLLARLLALGCGQSAPRAGQIFPDLVLPDWQGCLTRLSHLCNNGPIVLSFHRGLWCPWCRVESSGWSDAAAALAAAGARMIMISAEVGGGAAALADRARAQALVDFDLGLCLSLGLVISIPAALAEAYRAGGDNFDCTQPLRPWLAAIARFKWIDRLRLMEREASAPAVDANVASHEIDIVSCHAVRGLLSQLRPAQADAIRLVKLDGLSILEASECSGQSQSLVKINIHRGLKRLASACA